MSDIAAPSIIPSSLLEETKEFEEEQVKIDREFESIVNARTDLYENELKLKKRVTQQMKALSSLEKQVESIGNSSSSCKNNSRSSNNQSNKHEKLASSQAATEQQQQQQHMSTRSEGEQQASAVVGHEQEGEDDDVSTSMQKSLKQHRESLRKYHTEILNPGSKFLQMFLGSVNSVVLNGHASRRYKFKQEYEDFKRKCTLWNIPIAFLLLLLFHNRAIDTIYQLWLSYFYLTLAMRESILQVNGSRINTWWINHHYVSMLLVITMITWPETLIYQQFRTQFFIYSFYSSIVQLLQYQYQTQRLYVMKTLGKANQMDVANSDSTQVVLSKQFMFLLPFIFGGQLMQFCNGARILYLCWQANEWQEVQAYAVAAFFFVLTYGNFVTTIRIFKKKWRKWKSQKQSGLKRVAAATAEQEQQQKHQKQQQRSNEDEKQEKKMKVT